MPDSFVKFATPNSVQPMKLSINKHWIEKCMLAGWLAGERERDRKTLCRNPFMNLRKHKVLRRIHSESFALETLFIN